MSTPEAFTITRPPVLAAEDGCWFVDDDRVEQLWLPAIGPTSFCLLRLLDADLTGIEALRLTLPTSDVAERLFVKAERVQHSLVRLRRFALIDEDPIDTDTYEHPTYLVRATVRPVGPKEWRRLPASVRERHADLAL